MLYAARSAPGPQRSSRSITTPSCSSRSINRFVRAESEIARAGVDQDASKAKASSRRIGKDETHQTQPAPTRGAAIRLSAASSGAVLFKLRLSASEWRFALWSFTAKVVLFWLSELVICQWDQERWVCNVVGKGFIPCLITFALMDLLVIPQIRRLRNR